MVSIRILTLGLIIVSLAALIPSSSSETDAVKLSLVGFMKKLVGPDFPTQNNNILGWDMATNPCRNQWHGVRCDVFGSVVGIFLSGFRFSGALDAELLCSAESLFLLKLQNNTIRGPIPEEIGQCGNLAILDLSDNRFVGPIPNEMGSLTNLTTLDLSGNRLSGPIPETLGDLTSLLILDLQNNQLTGSIPESITRPTYRASDQPLRFFRAENNRLTGPIPEFNFEMLAKFNVSNNDLNGPIPDGAAATGFFGADCFMGNPGLCGEPLPYSCPQPPVQSPVPSGSPGRTELGLVMMMVSSILGVSLVSFSFRFVY
ncbi:unnamed protein product [Linum tenue]|uniref:Leucine-rich repeat-containing N-terminal plant-type domain-containing protein n=1 Tax=Linum tenue TaxID=586396 RepID=A0AAV0HWI4_9ROSI|nr:unnamed protein product [Linum tenue]